jgi:glycosyltransferase involved in cell wall biosynthesis
MAREQAIRLANAGWDIEVFTSRLAGDRRKLDEGNFPVHRYRCVNWQEEHLSLPVPFVSPRMLRDLVVFADSADLLLAHGHSYVGSMYAALASRITGRPLVVVQPSPFVSYPEPLQSLERLVDKSVGRWVLHEARTVVCVSRYVDAYVKRIAPLASTEVVHPGIDTERFWSLQERAGANKGPLRVLTLRRLVRRNGVDILVEAWRRANLDGGAELLIGGSGPELEGLRCLANADPSIRFLGHVPDEELPGLYRSADLFVVPSVSGEGFGLVAAEALASGVPVVATDGGATGEVVRDGIDGLVVRAGDPDELATALRRFAYEPELCSQMRLAARRRHPQLGWAEAMARLLEALESQIRRPVAAWSSAEGPDAP